jgi:hypothetical protein
MRSLRLVPTIVLACGLAMAPSHARAQAEPEERGTSSLEGVQVTAAADSWAGWPTELTTVIPLLVTIENHSTVPIRLRYQAFRLSAPGDIRRALPPLEIHGRETVAVGTVGLLPGPYVGGYYYPHLRPFDGPYLYDPLYYTSYYPLFYTVQLPTQDMVVKALREGVVEPGSVVQGYLYFHDGDPEGDMAMFEADVVNATSGAMLGTIEFPLEID